MTPPSDLPLSPHDLGAIIGRVQSRYIRAAPPREVFEPLLTDLLQWTGSEYGFMAEVLHDAHGAPYLRIEVLTNIAWEDATRALVERHARGGPQDALEFHNLNTLFGAALVTRAVVISNQTGTDTRRPCEGSMTTSGANARRFRHLRPETIGVKRAPPASCRPTVARPELSAESPTLGTSRVPRVGARRPQASRTRASS